ncbi:STAS domain-containing protein [Shewanella algae]|jgi:phospholipid transport system transporter-binding protein|uniref:ABC phospholipid uptake (Salvage) system anti-anti-sigma factor MlaB n=1 Tax=Shewanella algae TaxID=38313 RepID=A0AAD1KCF9_9GAMM|nr:STAS domain-containing protein [Shewanella algae]MBO2588118.1 STAS domain-containing protein [Shewanella algae]MBO2596680.1 STAS domain-containing protein [Shewanella algae]MBO2668040.1 STAS domain-containing protein [Shewanella algae]MBO2689396.1 STAS domain-containing protein [Shewanella algae]BCV46540.1 ABC phospholipid uptake (salvage) system anti-anti-sigma factor MlaB [Shewanella algae]
MKLEPQGDSCKLSGRLTQEEVARLWKMRKTLLPDDVRRLDLSELTYSDSAGMAFLMELVSLRKGELTLASPSPQVRKLIALYDLDAFFTTEGQTR